MTRKAKWIVPLSLLLPFVVVPSVQAQGFPGAHREALGERFQAAIQLQPLSIEPSTALDMMHRWNTIAINASGLDHTPLTASEGRVFGEQLGPGRSSRAMAIVHIAIFDAMNAIVGGYQSYTGIHSASPGTSKDAAIAQAAHDTLIVLFPSQKQSFDRMLKEDLRKVPEGVSRSLGVAVGHQAAAAILARRTADGSQHSEPRVGIEFITSKKQGKWGQDPISMIPIALGAYWNQVKPFVMKSSDQFRVSRPPALDGPEYAAAYNKVKVLGGDGVDTPTTRSAEQSEIGIYWAYDGTPSLCAPPRLYNQIAMQIADQMGTTDLELARLLALVNTAMADAGIAVWESKYYYQFWRPVTGIRSADGNPATARDKNFSPLGAPASNLTGPNFTPPFPSYPSGHAGFGGALFQILRRFYKTDKIEFTFMSDEFNGVTLDNQGNIRPLIPRSFSSFSQAEEENGRSRIYLGIHWSFDKTKGIAQGRRVADYVFNHAFKQANELLKDTQTLRRTTP